MLAAELWDPATESWSVLAPMAVPRLYHSTAALLPDARVVVAGGGQPPATGGTDNFNAQVYSPMVTAPADPNACSAGHYMLFLVNDDGVPSEAPIVRLCFAPEEVSAVRFVGKESLEWDPEEESDSYDVLRGPLSALRADGDFSGSTCIAEDLFATSITDAEPPPVGDGFYYLVAARGNEPAECPRGSLGSDLRDTTTAGCP